MSATIARKEVNAFRKKVALRIKSLRESASLSQKQLGQRSGLKVECIVQLELGTYKFTYLTIEMIAKGLGVQPSEIDESYGYRYARFH